VESESPSQDQSRPSREGGTEGEGEVEGRRGKGGGEGSDGTESCESVSLSRRDLESRVRYALMM